MDGSDQPISWLMFFTFGAMIFIMAGALIYFLRRRTKRAVASDALMGHGSAAATAAPDGALLELLAVALFAFIAMGSLTGGYASTSLIKSSKLMPPVGGQMPTNR